MESDTQARLDEIVAKESWSIEDHDQFLGLLFETDHAANKFKDLLGKIEADNPEPRGAAALKVGIARYMACRFGPALEALAAATDNKDRHFFQAMCYAQMREYDKAVENFDRAKVRGADADQMDLRIAEMRALAGDLDSAGKTVAALAKRMDDQALYHSLRGLVAELRGFSDDALAAYEQARALDPTCAEATFRLAYHLDLHGSEDEAIELYTECVARPPVHANALLNLAVLQEDKGDYHAAIAAVKRVLAINPNHARARLILKDCEAALVMYYDEEQAKRMAHRNAVLDIPVTDFELSVRARNCLKKMDIRTLGDLVRTSEATLMSYKNFGETSLKEIKDMLGPKGLSLGQGVEDAAAFSILSDLIRDDSSASAAGPAGDTGAPVSQVDFSIRVRRALELLGITSLGELAAKTEAELLACSNFGQTSLNEVNAKLAEHGMKLADHG
ncbi:MAG: DNA-directed RNA polymerase subunit alpha C-terminal domain-containing protein [Planctomycetota bacterium]|jgi:DNA-directed RNA polymerase subunit alpha